MFVHGLGGSLAQFKAILTSLVDVAPCLGIDLPGCGRSGFAPYEWTAYSPDALAKLLRVAIQEHVMQGQGFILVGHSLGCSLSALVASTSLNSQAHPALDVLGLVGICPAAEAPSGRKASILKALLYLPTPVFDLWRMWDRRGGPQSASVARFVGVEADIEVKILQERFNAQSQTAVYRRMAWGLLPHKKRRGMPGLDTWATLKLPLYLIGGDGDAVTSVENLAKIAHVLGRAAKGQAVSSTPRERSHPLQNGKLRCSDAGLADSDDSSPQLSPDKKGQHESELTLLDARFAASHNISSDLRSYTNRRSVLKTSILPTPASHGLLYDPATSRTLSGLIQGFLPLHIDTRLSLGWQLQHLTVEGKWDVKNLEKWRTVQPVSEPIAGIFRAMKTLREVDDEHTPKIFAQRYQHIINAVIDISHDSPVYDPKGLESDGIEYHKFPSVSKIPPTLDETRDFNNLVDRLRTGFAHGVSASSENKRSGPIGVHCHYGFNRTGFFLCSYLIEHESYSVQEAVDEFATQRPPGIRHPHFLDELFVRYCVGLKRAPTI